MSRIAGLTDLREPFGDLDLAAMINTASYVVFTRTVGGTPWYYAKNGLSGQIPFSGTDVTPILQSISALITKGTIFFKCATYRINDTIILPSSGDFGNRIAFIGEEGTVIEINTTTAFSLTGRGRISFIGFHIEMMVGAVSFLRTRRGGDNYSLFRCSLGNLSFDCGGYSNQIVLDLIDGFQIYGYGIYFNELGENVVGNSIAIKLGCTLSTHQGDCVFNLLSFTRIGASICIKFEGSAVGPSNRQHDTIYGLIGYDVGGVIATYAVQFERTVRTSIISPHCEWTNAYSFDANCDSNTIINQQTNVNISNNGTNTRIIGGNYNTINHAAGSMHLSAINYINNLTISSSILIESVYAIGTGVTINGTPTIRLGEIYVGNDSCTITGAASNNPAAPVEPAAAAKGSSTNKCIRNKALTVITIPNGTIIDKYYYRIQTVWTINSAQDIQFNVRSWDSGDNDADNLRIVNCRDDGTGVLICIEVLNVLGADHIIRIFTVTH